jgi:uncharacterized protein YkwD
MIAALAAAGTLARQQSENAVSGRSGASAKSDDPQRRSYTDDDLKPRIGDRKLREIELLELQCLDEVNRQRQAYGLRSLEFSRELLDVAREYSRWMAEENFFSHVDPRGRTVRQRVNDAGIKWRALGENLAYSNGYTNPVAASLRGWMDSTGHRRNILDRAFQKSAVGVWIADDGTVYFTEIFLQ